MAITASNFEIATPPGALVNLALLPAKILVPKPTWKEYSKAIPTADGGVKGGGWRAGTWAWAFLSLAQRAQLRTFCPNGASSPVYIRTWKTDGAFGYYEGMMVWPFDEGDEDKHQAGRALSFTIKFQNLKPYTPP